MNHSGVEKSSPLLSVYGGRLPFSPCLSYVFCALLWQLYIETRYRNDLTPCSRWHADFHSFGFLLLFDAYCGSYVYNGCTFCTRRVPIVCIPPRVDAICSHVFICLLLSPVLVSASRCHLAPLWRCTAVSVRTPEASAVIALAHVGSVATCWPNTLTCHVECYPDIFGHCSSLSTIPGYNPSIWCNPSMSYKVIEQVASILTWVPGDDQRS